MVGATKDIAKDYFENEAARLEKLQLFRFEKIQSRIYKEK